MPLVYGVELESPLHCIDLADNASLSYKSLSRSEWQKHNLAKHTPRERGHCVPPSRYRLTLVVERSVLNYGSAVGS